MALKILIAEDDFFSATLLQEILNQYGYEVLAVATNGEEALNKANELLPDLAIMDISMPGEIDGIDASIYIKEQLNIPVIYLTGNHEDEILQRALKSQPSGYILKPFNKTELFTVIEMAYQQHELKEKLRQNEELLTLTLQSIGDGVISTDSKGRITFMNEVAQNLTEIEKENALMKDLDEVYRIKNEKSGETYDMKVDKDLDHNFYSSLNDLCLVSTRGNSIPIEHKIAPIKNEHEVKGFIITFRDITTKKNARELLEKMNEKLEQMVIKRTLELQEKNYQLEKEIQINEVVEKKLQNALYKEIELSEIKSRIVTTISHEFKTPLTSILCSSELIEKYIKSDFNPEKLERHVKSIQNSVKSLNLLINDVFYIDKIDEKMTGLEISKIKIRKNCLDIIDEFKLGVGRNHIIKVNVENLEDEIEFDPNVFRKILSNLLSNAIKYSKNETVVDVVAETDGTNLRLTVTDQGIGIPEDDKKHIFKLFHRSSNAVNYEGTGLGLSILKQAVDLLGGDIIFGSEVGKGTTFTVTIPIQRNINL